MSYIYNDEDNAPMNDPYENLHHVTGCFSFSQMRAEDSGEYFDRLEAEKEEKYQKQQDELDGLLDMLGLTGKCRECANITELAEGFIINGLISNEQFSYLEHICTVCGGKGTGITGEKQQAWIDQDWYDRLEWAKTVLPRMSCAWCPNAFRIYGQYKDPDDEWNAIDSKNGCANCKYFQEVD